jgi:hypothetical protein
MLAIWPIEVAIAFGVAANALGALLGYVLIPRGDDDAAPTATTAPASARPA